MKKAYTKPELFCEEYQLSVSVAGHCADWMDPENTVDSNDYHHCGYYMGMETLFISTDVCTSEPSDDLDTCYQVPSDATRIFCS